MAKILREMRNIAGGYSTPQIKIRNATSNDPWGPNSSELAAIAQMTFGDRQVFDQLMGVLYKRLNDKGKNWRHVLKSLKLIDYCIHEGSKLVLSWAKQNLHIIKTLKEFQHIDECGRDVGHSIRLAASNLTSLLLDDGRLINEQRDRNLWTFRILGERYL